MVDPFLSEMQGRKVLKSKAFIASTEKYKELQDDNFAGWLDSVSIHVVNGVMVGHIVRPRDVPTFKCDMDNKVNAAIAETAQRLNSPLAW